MPERCLSGDGGGDDDDDRDGVNNSRKKLSTVMVDEVSTKSHEVKVLKAG
jgi:hypothetical protein